MIIQCGGGVLAEKLIPGRTFWELFGFEEEEEEEEDEDEADDDGSCDEVVVVCSARLDRWVAGKTERRRLESGTSMRGEELRRYAPTATAWLK